MKGLLVGFGTMGQTHAIRYTALGVSLVVVDLNLEKRRAAEAQGFEVSAGICDVDLEAIDFIDLCTPTDLHYEQIVAASRFAKPIFVEKPIVRTAAQAGELRRLLHPNLRLVVGEVEFFNRSLRPFLEYQERPSRVTMVREVNLEFFLQGARPWFLDEARSGGLVLDCMIHDIHLLLAKYGRPSVRHAQGHSRRYDVIDEASTVLDFGDFQARLAATWTSSQRETPIRSSISWEAEDGARFDVACSSYAIGSIGAVDDAFFQELKTFLAIVRGAQAPQDLSPYLDAVEIAEEIRARISAGQSGSRAGST